MIHSNSRIYEAGAAWEKLFSAPEVTVAQKIYPLITTETERQEEFFASKIKKIEHSYPTDEKTQSIKQLREAEKQLKELQKFYTPSRFGYSVKQLSKLYSEKLLKQIVKGNTEWQKTYEKFSELRNKSSQNDRRERIAVVALSVLAAISGVLYIGAPIAAISSFPVALGMLVASCVIGLLGLPFAYVLNLEKNNRKTLEDEYRKLLDGILPDDEQPGEKTSPELVEAHVQ